jgi:hypothetical protein
VSDVTFPIWRIGIVDIGTFNGGGQVFLVKWGEGVAHLRESQSHHMRVGGGHRWSSSSCAQYINQIAAILLLAVSLEESAASTANDFLGLLRVQLHAARALPGGSRPDPPQLDLTSLQGIARSTIRRTLGNLLRRMEIERMRARQSVDVRMGTAGCATPKGLGWIRSRNEAAHGFSFWNSPAIGSPPSASRGRNELPLSAFLTPAARLFDVHRNESNGDPAGV